MKRTLTILTLFYYGAMLMAVLVVILAYFMGDMHIDKDSQLGIKISYIVIMYVIISVPTALALFSRRTKQLKSLENEDEKYRKYLFAGKIRIIAIALGFFLGVFFFCILQDQSLIFCAGISAIALYFCKPTPGKIELDLTPVEESENNEI